MSLDDQNRLRCITQTQKILKNQSSYLTLLDGISPQCIADPKQLCASAHLGCIQEEGTL